MTSHDGPNDPVFLALGDLPVWDVDTRRAQRLGVRCRAVLATRTQAAAANAGSARWTKVTGLALLVAWCATYVAAIVHRGMLVWGL